MKYLLFIAVLVHLLDIQLHICLVVQCMSFEVNVLHKAANIESFGSKMISTRYIWYNTFTILSVGW